jgi:transposase
MQGIPVNGVACANIFPEQTEKKSRFHCRNCGHKAHADVNAAVNIRDNYLLSTAASQSVEQAVVNQPNVTALTG